MQEVLKYILIGFMGGLLLYGIVTSLIMIIKVPRPNKFVGFKTKENVLDETLWKWSNKMVGIFYLVGNIVGLAAFIPIVILLNDQILSFSLVGLIVAMLIYLFVVDFIFKKKVKEKYEKLEGKE